MSNSPKVLTVEPLAQDEAAPSLKSRLRNLGTELAFSHHGIRVGLELTGCVFVYAAVSAFLPLSLGTVTVEAQQLFAWFGACFAVALFDQQVFMRPFRKFRAVCALELEGKYLEALELLETISPASSAAIPLPRSLYHLKRATIYIHSERYTNAAHELSQAFAHGLSPLDYYVTRSELFRYRKEFEAAQGELRLAEYVVGENPVLLLEEAVLRFEQRDMKGARKALENVLSLPNAQHPHGESTYALGHAYWEATRLWTGEAEEGLDGLSEAIANLQIAADYIDSLRPVVASLLSERAYYFVTHREPAAADLDTKFALDLCRYPHVRARTEAVEEERSWRFPNAPK